LTKKTKNSYFSIRCNNLTVPFSFHQLSPDIANVQVEFRDSSLNTKTSTIQLQSGNYNCINVLDELKAKVIASCQTSQGLYIGFTPQLSFSYSSTTNKSTYTFTSVNANERITVLFSTNTLLGKFFGFNINLTLNPNVSVTSPNIAIANPVNSIYLRSGNLKQLYNREWIVEPDSYSDILYVSPIFSQQNTYIQSNHQGDECIISDNDIKDINLYISTNLNFNPIELNGLDFSCSITISEVVLESYIPISDSTMMTQFLNDKAISLPIKVVPPLSDEGKEGQVKDEETIKLEQERDLLLTKLERQKRRLERKLEKNKNEFKE
jgi:hypothetical protein